MIDPLDETVKTYQQHFNTYVGRIPVIPEGEMKEWMDTFASYIPKGGTILELGSASGRDARYLSSKGYTCVCTDIIPEALRKLSKEGFETAEYDFRNEPKAEWVGKFDAVFANAVLLHAPQSVFEFALKNIATILNNDGVVAFSLQSGDGEKIESDRIGAPRYFRYHSVEGIRDILNKLPFEVISITSSEDDKWIRVIASKKDLSPKL